LQAAVSRQREFLADASAVKYTRVVDGLGGALRKIADQQLQGRSGLQSAHASSLAHLLLSNRGAGAGWRALWHTHPTLAERLRRLYGRDVLPLPAPVLTLGSGEVEALVAFAPGLPGGGAALPGRVAALPRGGHPPDADLEAPEAQRHDALQRPASFDAKAREQDALARIALWHGPGEWQAAMLALALDFDAPADTRRLAWRRATAELGVAAAVEREITALGAGARRAVFAQLVQRARAVPGQHRRLQRALMQRWPALPASAATQWRALALALLLDDRRRALTRADGSASLTRHAAAAHAATALLAQALGAPPGAAQTWRDTAVQALVEFGGPVPRGSAGLAPASGRHSLLLALRVRRIAPMQRPLLLRAWWLAAERSGLAVHTGTGDALHLAWLLLDVPVPESLVS